MAYGFVYQDNAVLYLYPIKQGLKPFLIVTCTPQLTVLYLYPIKQGLKLLPYDLGCR